jgi:Flp pilus assembly CpaE family ATPase
MTDIEFVEAAITKFLQGLIDNNDSKIGFTLLIYPLADDPEKVRLVSNTNPEDVTNILEAFVKHRRGKS